MIHVYPPFSCSVLLPLMEIIIMLKLHTSPASVLCLWNIDSEGNSFIFPSEQRRTGLPFELNAIPTVRNNLGHDGKGRNMPLSLKGTGWGHWFFQRLLRRRCTVNASVCLYVVVCWCWCQLCVVCRSVCLQLSHMHTVCSQLWARAVRGSLRISTELQRMWL